MRSAHAWSWLVVGGATAFLVGLAARFIAERRAWNCASAYQGASEGSPAEAAALRCAMDAMTYRDVATALLVLGVLAILLAGWLAYRRGRANRTDDAR
jgi:hypothetical protein